jgi:cytoskeletal protein CcmA (bactofilin family)/anti-sigma factor RsiW
MTCPSGEIWTAYADDEATRAELQELEAHLAGCPDCRSLVHALREENRLLARALDEVPNAARQRSPALPGVTVGVGTLVAIAAGFQVASGWLADLSQEAPAGLVDGPRIVLGLLFETVFYLLREGASMLESIVATVLVPGLIVLGAFVALSLRRRRARGVMALCALLATAAPSLALEVRGGHGGHGERDRIVVGAGEIVDDSLAVAGDSVTVDGTVTGNLFAAGHRVIVRGTVKGDLLAVAERVEIEGTVEGNVFAGGSTVIVRGSVGRSLHCAAADTIRVDPSGRVDGDTVGFAGTIDLDGHVGRDVVAHAGLMNVRGGVGRNLSVRARHLRLEAAAKVGGNLVARVRDAAAVQVDEGASVAGKTETRLLPREKSRYARVAFYVWKLIWLAAAFLVGLALHALLPGLFPARLPASATLLLAAGLGFGALVVVPAAALLLMLTLIGLPAGLLVLGLWLAGLYLAQILVATVIGRGFLQRVDAPPASMASVLLVGLVCVAVSVNLPYVGGLLRFVVIVLGLGLAVMGAHHGARRGVEA